MSWRDVFALNERYEGVWQIYETERHLDGGLVMTVPADGRTFKEKSVAEFEADRLWRERFGVPPVSRTDLPLREQERLRVKAEAPEAITPRKAFCAGRDADRLRVLALIDRELGHVRPADGQLWDVLQALRKDVEEGYEVPQVHPETPLVDHSTNMVTEPRAAAEEA